MAPAYSIYEAKAKLSEILRLVKANREVIVTERGKRVAKIVPYVEPEDTSLEERFDALAQRGVIQPAQGSPQRLSDAMASAAKGPGALARFLDERD